jgi:hypothetical protein
MASHDIPRSVLSEHFEERLSGRRVLGLLFLTFEFDPGFFEQEVLPVMLDTPVSHAEVPRLLQLEAALREVPHGVTVIYDWSGLRTSDYRSPRLDVRRIPARVRTGIFHAKNVLILTEDLDASDDGSYPRRLLVASLSANLTRSGWWENVEACHVEDLEAGEVTCLREPLLELLKQCKNRTTSPDVDEALAPYRAFILGLSHRAQRTQNGALWPQFYCGGEDVADFLATTIPSGSGYNLEIVSPYFDKTADAKPLRKLIKALSPKEARVYLPKDSTGSVLCSEEFFDAVRTMDDVSWASLPDDMLRLGKGANSGFRSVHAKVYRVFKTFPKQEYFFVGSANLTSAAFSATGGNFETGFLVEVDPLRKPDFWLQAERHKPQIFTAPDPEESAIDKNALPVQIRFSWKDKNAFGFWDGKKPSPAIALKSAGVALGEGLRWPPREWTALPVALSVRIAEELRSLSLITVILADGREGPILVQEEGMSLKPDLTRTLPVSDILEYWSLLKPEQRQAFLDGRIDLLGPKDPSGANPPPTCSVGIQNDMFQRCAGIFHAFAILERRVKEALTAKHEAQATALLFGQRFDSLGTVLQRVLRDESGDTTPDSFDLINRYLVLMCAQQLISTVRVEASEFWRKFPDQATAILERLSERSEVRDRIVSIDPQKLPDFMDWFDRWFLRKAEPVEAL